MAAVKDLKSFTWVKVSEQQFKNTLLKVKVLHSEFDLKLQMD